MAKKVDYSVEERLRALYDLQLIDSRIDKLRSVRGELPLEVQDLEDEVSGLEVRVEKVNGEIGDLENTKSWCISGELRINNFKTIRENENYIVATHDVIQEGKPKSNVLVYAEQINEEFVYWKIQRAFES